MYWVVYTQSIISDSGMGNEMHRRSILLQLILLVIVFSILSACNREQPAAPVTDNKAAVDVTALTNRVAELEKQAQRLRDISAIKRLQRAYGYYVDNEMWDEVVDLFSDNGTMEIALDGVYRGKEHIRKYLYALSSGRPGLPAGVLNEHYQLQPVVDVAKDGRTAKGRWRALIMSGVWKERATWGIGPYENTYVKENGVWKIKRIHWYETLMVPYEGGWTAERRDFHNGRFVSDQLPPDAPPTEQYEVWPGAYLPPYHYKNPITGQ